MNTMSPAPRAPFANSARLLLAAALAALLTAPRALADRLEPNDGAPAEIGTAPGVHLTGLSLGNADTNDLYRFSVLRADDLALSVGVASNGVAVEVRDAGGALIGSGTSGGGVAAFGLASVAPGWYTVSVRMPFAIATNALSYTLSVEPQVSSDTTVYYVNAPSVLSPANSFYTTAPGSDANDGLTPATPKATVADVLNDYDLDARSLVLIDAADYTMSATVGSGDAGAAFAGVPLLTQLSAPSGQYPLTLLGADGCLIHGLLAEGSGGGFQLRDSDRNTLQHLYLNAAGAGVAVTDDAGSTSASNVVMRCAFVYGPGVTVANSPDTLVASNWFDNGSSVGVRLTATWRSTVRDNSFPGSSPAVELIQGEQETVRNNAIWGSRSTGFNVDRTIDSEISLNAVSNRTAGCYISGTAAEPSRVLVTGNTFWQGSTGVRLYSAYCSACEVANNTVAGCSSCGIRCTEGDGHIHNNAVSDSLVGIEYGGAVEGVYANLVRNNTTGLKGLGSLGGTDWLSTPPNEVVSNSVGVLAEGVRPVQFNRVSYNGTGIRATGACAVRNNALFGNAVAGILVDGPSGVQVRNNSLYCPAGNGIQVQGAAQNTDVRNNIAWAQAGYALRVERDSQRGFACDYNNWFATAAGHLVWWQKAFDDLFDWQAESDFDRHSLGATALHPLRDDPLFLSAATGDLRLQAGSTSVDAGDPASACALEPAPNGGRINLGAHGGTALATSSPASRISIDYPEYYTDWPVDSGRSISWTYHNLAGDLDIDLLDAGGSKVVDIATVAVTNLTFGWSPQDSGVSGSLAGRYRIRLTSVPTPAASDVSRETFVIPPSTNVYFLNDDALADDEYTTAAGGNRNTGTTPADPKRSLFDLLFNYNLQAGDTIRFDTGHHIQIRNVLVSAQPGVNDDEGMLLTGPTGPSRHAVLDRDNASAEATNLEIREADRVTLQRLTFLRGDMGVWVRQNSTEFAARFVNTSSNRSDGLRVESDCSVLVLSNLVASANGGDGVDVDNLSDTLDPLDIRNVVADRNGGYGLRLFLTPLGTLSNVQARFNGDFGLYAYASGAQDTHLHACVAMNNADGGFYVAHASSDRLIIVGDADLPAGRGCFAASNGYYGVLGYYHARVRGNAVFDNTANSAVGIYLTYDSRAEQNVVSGNARGLYAQQPDDRVDANRVVDNVTYGIGLGDGDAQGNVVSGSLIGIDADPYYDDLDGTILNNLVTGSANAGIRVRAGGPNTALLNNTVVHASGGKAIELYGDSQSVRLRNNIVSVSAGTGIAVDPNSQTGFTSDYNLFHLTGAAKAGLWQGVTRSTLGDWRAATFQEGNSLAADPLFVSPAGGDYHVQSLTGSRHGGSLAPAPDPASGLPVDAGGAWIADAAQSPAIDRADAATSFAREPAPNGSFANIGAYGASAQASLSPTNYVLVLVPNGGESWPAEQSFEIRWRSHDTNGTAQIDLLQGGGVALAITNGIPNSGSFTWLVPDSVPAAANYRIRVTRALGGEADESDADLAITGPISIYYVNDGSVNPAGDWCTAAGSDANDGLSPATPKATILGVLAAYDLDAGDVIRVDDGAYALTVPVTIAAADSGVRIEGYSNPAYPARKALVSRGNAASPAFDADGADNVTLASLYITGGQTGVRLQNDADGLTIDACTIYSHDDYGVYISDGCDGTICSRSAIYGTSGADATDMNYGVYAYGDGARLTGNTVSNCATYGIYLLGNYRNGLVQANTVARNGSYGIYISADVAAGGCEVLGNDVASNGSHGICVYGGVAVRQNEAHGHAGSGIYGIYLGSQTQPGASENLAYSNRNGICVMLGSLARNNRCFANTDWGLIAHDTGCATHNQVYHNGNGILAATAQYSYFTGDLANNLSYANAGVGIQARNTYTGAEILNNTVYNNGSHCLSVYNSAQNLSVRNNIFCPTSGAAIAVAGDSQVGFQSDNNLFHPTGAGYVANWDNTRLLTRADWFYELNYDAHGRTGDPLFLDPDGADNTLGYRAATATDYGADDDFRLQSGSPALDMALLTDHWLEEPQPNGGRRDAGAYGNTPGALASDFPMVQVLAPNGLEKFEEGESVEIAYRSDGLTTTGVVARINCNGPAVDRWGPSAYDPANAAASYTGYAIDRAAADRPAPEAVYQTYLSPPSGAGGESTWSLPVPNGNYLVRLHFAEPSYGAGTRVFDVFLQGALAFDNVDVYALAGGYRKALVLSAAATAAAGGGLAVRLVNVTSTSALLCGIELLKVNPAGLTSPTVALAYTPDDGASWVVAATNAPLDADGRGGVNWPVQPQTLGGANHGWMRVTGEQGAHPDDLSDEAFLVATNATEYYVNDASVAGDTLTSAPGDNANSGKSPDKPVAGIQTIVARYNLDPGDTIHVDCGSYVPLRNILLDASDAGVRITGDEAGNSAVDRRNNNTSSYVFELAGADGVTLRKLDVLGGYAGIYLRDDADDVSVERCAVHSNYYYGVYAPSGCDGLRVSQSLLYGPHSGPSGARQSYGLHLSGNGVALLGNTVFSNDTYGAYLSLSAAGAASSVSSNTFYRNGTYGLYATASQNTQLRVERNTAWDNGAYGLLVNGNGYKRVYVCDNEAYGHSGAGDVGIYIQSYVEASGNVSHGNARGFFAQYEGAVLLSNRAYNNSEWGIVVASASQPRIARNHVYSNGGGLLAYPGSHSYFIGTIENNRIYANALRGLRVQGATSGTLILNNTIYQPIGNGIELASGCANAALRNNIIDVAAGFALYAESDSQSGLASDYNLFHVTGSGKMAWWSGREILDWTNFTFKVNQDWNSVCCDPAFEDPDGPDNDLGYNSVYGVDRGLDDDFRLTAGSAGVDAAWPGDPWLEEPFSNGARRNLGAYGNTPEAQRSDRYVLQVLYPNSLEKYREGDPLTIEWRSDGYLPTGVVARLNAYGGQVGKWAPDKSYRLYYPNGGNLPASTVVDTNGLVRPAPRDVYASYAAPYETYDGALIAWHLPVPDGDYLLRLHFVEPVYTSAGYRSFDVRLQGATVLSGLDLYAVAGARFRAHIEEFSVSASGGGIDLELTGVVGSPVLCGIELLRGVDYAPASALPLAVDLSADDGATFPTPLDDDAWLDADGDGRLAWAASPATGAHVGRIRVGYREKDYYACDISDKAFLVASNGAAFYVNDDSTLENAYTTTAGSDVNSGRAPGAPMATLGALLARYDLGPGDVVYVDAGQYDVLNNILVSAADQGVRIQGPDSGLSIYSTPEFPYPVGDAVLNRGNVSAFAHVMDISCVASAEVARVQMTGAYAGLYLSGASNVSARACTFFGNAYAGAQSLGDCLRFELSDSELYGVSGGSDDDDQDYGARLAGHAYVMRNCSAHDCDYDGCNAEFAYGALPSLVENNTLFDNASQGIYCTGSGAGTVRANVVSGSGSYGIRSAGPTVLCAQNRVSGGASYGIYASSGTTIWGNTCDGNLHGIYASSCAVVSNTVYNNANRGLHLYAASPARCNRVYDNLVGIYAEGVYSAYQGSIEDNLVYENSDRGVQVSAGNASCQIVNNTIEQQVGNALELVGDSTCVSIRNNILIVGAGRCLHVESLSTDGLTCDFNLFHYGSDPAARVGYWGSADYATLPLWQAATGLDRRSLFADPRFIDPDGDDDVLGYDLVGGTAYDGGLDDNYQLATNSPAIDRAEAWLAPPSDLLGNPRRSDPGTPDAGVGTLAETPLGSSLFTATGSAKSWRSAGSYWSQTLPFYFVLYGRSYDTVYVSSEGFIQFRDYTSAGDGDNTSAKLASMVRVAPLWDNLRTDRTGDDIYVATSATNILIRWNASLYADNSDVNVAVELFKDGRVRFHYGDGNTNLTPTVGLSAGDGRFMHLSAYDGQAQLRSAQSVEFTPAPSATGALCPDQGAYEFQGDSGATVPPAVVATLPPAVHSAGRTGIPFGEIAVDLSAPLDVVEATVASSYELLRDSDGDSDFDGDDQPLALAPAYTSLTTRVYLRVASGTLSNGYYRLRLRADRLHDASLLPLDGNADGTGGDDYVRAFTLDGHGIQLLPDSASLAEGESRTFNVRLREEPAGETTVSNLVSGGALTIDSGASMTFTPLTWSNAQAVSVRALHDVGSVDETASLTSQVPGFDSALATVTVLDDDRRIVFATNLLRVAEGSYADVGCRLAGEPAGVVTALVSCAGDSSFSLSAGATLVFSQAAWNVWQNIRVAASDDADTADGEGTLTAGVTAPGWQPGSTALREAENDRSIIVESAAITVREGFRRAFRVKLQGQPAAPVAVQLARTGGDEDLRPDANPFARTAFFSSENYSAWQRVWVEAAGDADTADGSAAFEMTAADWATATGAATESDDDRYVRFDDFRVDVPAGETRPLGVALGGPPSGSVTVSVARAWGNTNIAVSAQQVVFTAANWSEWQYRDVSAAVTARADNGFARLRGSATNWAAANADAFVTIQTNAWSRRLAIRFAYYQPMTAHMSGEQIYTVSPAQETLTNFPALVRLSPQVAGFSYAQVAAGAADLRFTDASGAQFLNHQIELWDTNGESVVWVEVPELANSNTVIYALWGNPAATAPTCRVDGATWDDACQGVWHLSETVADGSTVYNRHADSTRNARALDQYGNDETPGAMAQGQDFVAANSESVRDNTLDAYNPGAFTSFTFSAWLRADQSAGSRWALSKGDTGSDGWRLGVVNGSPVFALQDNGLTRDLATTIFSTGVWHLVAGVLDREAGVLRLSVNGEEAGGHFTTYGNDLAYVDDLVNSGQLLGGYGYFGTGNYFDGQLDELRVETAARSRIWLWARYTQECPGSALIVFGDAGPQPGQPDTDGDGLYDEFESLYFGGPTNGAALADSDADGYPNLDEQTCGTDPTNALSRLTLAVYQLTPQGPVLKWSSAAGRSYDLLWSSNLLFSLPAVYTSGLPATPSINTLTDTVHAAESAGFYRVRVNWEP